MRMGSEKRRGQLVIFRLERETRLKINLGGMPHLAAGLELELQDTNFAYKILVPEKATKVN